MVSGSDCRGGSQACAEGTALKPVNTLLARRANLECKNIRRDIRVDTSSKVTARGGFDEESQPNPTKCSLLGLSIAAASTVAGEAELHDLFDTLDILKDGSLSQLEMRGAIEHLEKHWSLGLGDDDDQRLFTYLCTFRSDSCAEPSDGVPHGISRERFVTGIRRLVELCLRVKAGCTSLQNMKVVLMAAFDRFDTDGDGQISREEMLTAMRRMGVHLEQEDIGELYTFLLPDRGDQLTVDSLASKRSLKEEWAEASSRSLEQLRKSKGIDGISALLSSVQKELAAEGSWEDKVQRGLSAAWDGIDDVCKFVELGIEMAGVGIALKYLEESMEEVVQNHAVSDLDLNTVLPFVTLIGVGMMNTAKELDEFVPKEMTEDEAQLYGQVFHPRGFSQAEFRRLLSCPGFHWEWAESGEVIHDVDDRTLRILVRGSAEVFQNGQQQLSAVLHAGSTIGETSFMTKRPHRSNESVRARERVFFACWDHDKLRETLASDAELSVRLDTMLTQAMMANFRAKIKLSKKMTASTPPLEHRPTSTRSLTQIFQSLEAVDNGVQSAEGLPLPSSTSPTSIDAVTSTWTERAVRKELVQRMVPKLCASLSLGDCDRCHRRLSAFIDAGWHGLVDIEELKARLMELEECIARLNGLSVHELESTVFHSFEQFDANGDGAVDEEEFLEAVERLRMPLSAQQAQCLFDFLDVNKDGHIQMSEWKAHCGGGRLSWGEALMDSLQEQVERKGLTKLSELLLQLCAVLKSEGDLVSKVRRAQKILMDSGESLAAAMTSAADASGAFAALCGIWREVLGMSSWSDISDVDMAPFVIFFGILGVSAVRRKAEGEVSNLSEAEAMLYATSFEKDGITVTDFQKLLKYGNARWETLSAGDVASGPSDKSLKIIYSGTCEVVQPGTETTEIAGRGRILGANSFLDIDLEQVARAAEPTAVLSFERKALKDSLASDDSLIVRFNRVLTRSVVEAFVDVGVAAHRK